MTSHNLLIDVCHKLANVRHNSNLAGKHQIITINNSQIRFEYYTKSFYVTELDLIDLDDSTLYAYFGNKNKELPRYFNNIKSLPKELLLLYKAMKYLYHNEPIRENLLNN